MKRVFLLLLLFACAAPSFAQSSFVKLVTNKGSITILLYDETPKHRDMFLKGIKEGLFKDAEFNRVIKSFVSQGGELDDSIMKREAQHPEIPLKRVDAEISPNLFHKKGMFGAGRNDNPEKKSYLNQIYIVAGKVHTDEQLDATEKRTGRAIPADRRMVYKTLGGTPHLDGDYTLFGEIVAGMDVADAINAVAVDKNDLPIEKIVFNPVILSKKEVSVIRKQLKI